MRKKSSKWMISLSMAVMLCAAVVGCTVLNTAGKAAYTAGSQAVNDYCALPQATRAVGQLVLVGKVYNSGVCDVIKGDVDLREQLATATAAQINNLIAARVASAVASGKIDQATADVILAGATAASTAAADAIVVTTSATTRTEQTAAIITDTTAAPTVTDPVKAG